MNHAPRHGPQIAPNPALVTQGAAQRLPRLALLIFCAAYVLPGVFGRDPWKNADLAAFGQMLSMAEGRSSWLSPMLGGVATGGAPLPHGLGALFIALGQGWLDPALAARIPFALLLVLTLAGAWYAAYGLARTDAAQPLPLAFGGEAHAVDYARAIADAAILALIATLGLLQLGHETTPELAQLAAIASLQWAWAASMTRGAGARLVAALALVALAASGAPFIAVALGLSAAIAFAFGATASLRGLWPWMLLASVAAAVVAGPLHAWQWRLELGSAKGSLRLLAWFLWPAGLLALWTIWRWRRQLSAPHLLLPLLTLALPLLASLAMGGSDRALMLALPGAAVLAAFALPTLRRSAAAAIDWFSVIAFTVIALFIWLMYVAMQTGVPAQPAANVMRLAPGFAPTFSLPALLLALTGSAAWLWLVRWRTKKHRDALWKSLVLPAGGVALSWLLLMTLWLPLLDYARSYRAHMTQIGRFMPRNTCIAAPEMPLAAVAALEYHGHWRVDRSADAVRGSCGVMLRIASRRAPRIAAPEGWIEVTRLRRPADSDELMVIYRRSGPAQPTSVAALSLR